MKLLFFFLALVVPQLALAQQAGFSFTPPTTDLSIGYLAAIFGVVDGVLHGTGSQILGTMFGQFNSAILTIGGVVLMYMMIVATLNTAHEGEVMGKKWKSIWIPIRSVIGISFMLPKATGYSFVQIFVMWLVVQGVGAADSVWNAALNYLNRGGVLIQQNQTLAGMSQAQNATNNQTLKLVMVAGNILKAETCMYTLHNALVNQQNTVVAPQQVPDFTSSLVVTGTPSNLTPPCYKGDTREGCPASGDTGGSMNFPGNVSFAGKNYQGVCGSTAWSFTSDANPANNPGGLGAYDSRSVATQQIVLDVQPLAYTLSQILVPTGGNQTASNITSTNLTIGELVNTATDYMAIMGPYFNEQTSNFNQSALNFIEQAEQNGWILAGSYYFDLTAINNAYTVGESTPPTPSFSPNFSSSSFPAAAQSALEANLTANPVTTCPPSNTSNVLDSFICNEYNSAQTTQTNPNVAPTTAVAWSAEISGVNIHAKLISGKLGDLINVFPSTINSLVGSLDNLLANQGQETGLASDPIVQISAMGSAIITGIEAVWVGGAVAIFFISLIGSIATCGSNIVGNAINSLLMWLIPLLTAVMFTLFVAGATMQYYVPMIPYILFIFTVIGWFAAVIEAMIAAPLVAFGLTIPEGHEHFGLAQHALMLLLDVFIRPSLMIFGFLTAIILVHVALWLLNTGLYTALGIEKNVISPDILHILSFTAVLFIYVGLVLAIINRCFALIHEVPNRVLRWIGGTIQSYGEERGLGEVEKTFQAGAGLVGGAMEKAQLQDQMGAAGAAVGKALKGKGAGSEAEIT